MWCEARGSGSMAGAARATLGGGGSRRRGRSPASVWKEEEGGGWAEWGKRPNGPTGLKSEDNFFSE
jgi:hypothetical protein